MVVDAEIAGLVAEIPGMVADTSASILPGSETAESAVTSERGDLTAFFAIGVVINVLLVMAFLVWAVGQWRKKK